MIMKLHFIFIEIFRKHLQIYLKRFFYINKDGQTYVDTKWNKYQVGMVKVLTEVI